MRRSSFIDLKIFIPSDSDDQLRSQIFCLPEKMAMTGMKNIKGPKNEDPDGSPLVGFSSWSPRAYPDPLGCSHCQLLHHQDIRRHQYRLCSGRYRKYFQENLLNHRYLNP